MVIRMNAGRQPYATRAAANGADSSRMLPNGHAGTKRREITGFSTLVRNLGDRPALAAFTIR